MAMNNVLIIVVAICGCFSQSSARYTQSAVSSALQDILSPANTEKAMQLIKMAGSRSNRIAVPEMARSLACNELPSRYASNDYLPRAMVKEMPVRVISGDGYARRGNPVREMKQIAQPNLKDSLVLPKEIFQSMVLPREARPYQTLPAASNPYLPVASPVSAFSPGCMPPPTQPRGQFLRKIPIPPPSL